MLICEQVIIKLTALIRAIVLLLHNNSLIHFWKFKVIYQTKSILTDQHHNHS